MSSIEILLFTLFVSIYCLLQLVQQKSLNSPLPNVTGLSQFLHTGLSSIPCKIRYNVSYIHELSLYLFNKYYFIAG
nr:MAG TPA: hypothetical protein [Bacteriophage sp.]